MSEADIRTKFPSLRPITKAPGMRLINGCGTRVVGRRDMDAETQSYVTTLCFCLLFIPIFAIRAYRVVASPRGGWYFLGIEPLSVFARVWNLILGLVVITAGVSVSLTVYTSRPEYIARQQMVRAAKLTEEGQLAKAATLYGNLVAGNGFEAANANEALKGLVDRRCADAPGNEAAGVFTQAARFSMRPGAYSAAELVARGMTVAEALGKSNYRGAIALLEVLRPLALDSRDMDKASLPLLRRWAGEEPNSLDAAVALSSQLLAAQQAEEAGKILLPFKDKPGGVGVGEGARVLGLIFIHQGKLDEACTLLLPYVKPRLELLHAAEKAANDIQQTLIENELNRLRKNEGPPELFRRLESATDDQQKIIIREYLNERLKDNPVIAQRFAELEKESRVVPVVMQVGVALLQRAQGLPDNAERRKQLESAQELFLSIKGAVGESDEYRLFLGQVYYWLGKQKEGRALFDEFLDSKNRSALAILQIATALRDLGFEAETRTLAEEAYNKATKSDERYGAAHLRSLVSKDTDDEIEWLRKSDPNDTFVKITLTWMQGHKAYAEGREDEAAAQFRAALEICNTQTRSRPVLNHISLVSNALYQITGDPADMARAVDAIQQALVVEPSDPILMFNASIAFIETSVLDVAGKDLDLRTLHASLSLGLLDYLNNDEPGRAALAQRIAEHPGTAKAMAYFDQIMIISSKNTRSYSMAATLQAYLHNEEGLKAIERRLSSAGIEVAEEIRQAKEAIAGVNDAKALAALNAELKRMQTVATALRSAGGPSLAYALARQADVLIQRDVIDGASDPDAVVRLARDAYVTAPSSGTRDELENAYAFRIFKQLRKSDPAFDQFARQYYRSLGSQHILAYLIQQKDPLGQKILAHPDFAPMLELFREDLKNYPKSGSASVWAMCSVADPALAQTIADNFRNVPWHALNRSIAAQLSPSSGGLALDRAWFHLAQGQIADAQTAVAKPKEQGIPVPQLR
jgi:hypothetical protein